MVRTRHSEKIVHVRVRSIVTTGAQRHSSSHQGASRRKQSDGEQNETVPKSPQLAKSQTSMVSYTITPILTDDKYPNDKGFTQDHHHRKKNKKRTKCPRLCIALMVVIILLVLTGIIIAAALLATRVTEIKRMATNPVLRWQSTGMTVAGEGSGGVNGNALKNPRGFRLSRDHILYIVEERGQRINRWISGAPNGTVIADLQNGTSGGAANAFNRPIDLELLSNGDTYIADGNNNRLQYWPSGASSGTTIAGTGSNTSVFLHVPFGVTSNPLSNTLYITSSFNHSVISYPSGDVVAGGHGPGNSNQQLNQPEGIIFDLVANNLFIPNYAGHTIFRWSLGATYGTPVAGVPGVSGQNSTLLSGPNGITMDPMGNIYVTDCINHRIQLFMNGERMGRTIAGVTGLAGNNATLLHFPAWVQLDNQLNLYVADWYNGRIQKFQRY